MTTLKIKMISKVKATSKMKMTSKMKVPSKMRRTSKIKMITKVKMLHTTVPVISFYRLALLHTFSHTMAEGGSLKASNGKFQPTFL